MHLPTVQEIEASLPEGIVLPNDQITEALELATTVLEVMVGQPIPLRTIHQHLLLSNRPEKLLYFPVENVRADDEPLFFEANTGKIYPELELSNYTVTYSVGYERERIPAIIVQAVKHLALFRLLGDEEDREEATASIMALRLAREKLKKEREDG